MSRVACTSDACRPRALNGMNTSREGEGMKTCLQGDRRVRAAALPRNIKPESPGRIRWVCKCPPIPMDQYKRSAGRVIRRVATARDRHRLCPGLGADDALLGWSGTENQQPQRKQRDRDT